MDTETAVSASVVVEAPIDHAFKVFTEDIASWWPPEHHVLEAKLADMVFEPRVGGHVLDRGVDGSECRWARVLAYEPPTRVVFSWDISLEWKIQEDLDKTSEVEVRFVAEGPEPNSSTATSTATATVGRACATGSVRRKVGSSA
jgi:uncharacterized protein YndB with AHSA1/START domain